MSTLYARAAINIYLFNTPRIFNCKHYVPRNGYSSGRPNNPKSASFKLSLMGAAVGAIVGTGYSIHQLNKPNTHILNEESVIPLVDERIPVIKPTKVIKHVTDQSGLKLTLFQYQTCPFCCKVRAFLDYHGISYNIVEVDPVLRQAIKWSTNYKKVPILLTKVEGGYQPLNDSSMIISAMASLLTDTNQSIQDIVKCYPLVTYADESGSIKQEIMNRYFLMLQKEQSKSLTNEEIISERKWRQWADDKLVHVLSPNVYRTREEALQAFNWFSQVGEWEIHFPAWERNVMVYVGALAMWAIGKRLKKRHNLKDDVRLSLYDECNNWSKAIQTKGTPFMGGKKPNLADITVYGYLSSIEGCDAFSDLLKHSNIGAWYEAMKEEVLNHNGSKF